MELSKKEKFLYAPYSFSKLSLHDQCNRKFKYRYLDKVKPQSKDMTALLKGGAVHSILENYPNPSTHKLAPKYQDIAKNFLMSDLGSKYINLKSVNEMSFGLTKDLEPAVYRTKEAIFGGFIDYVCTMDNETIEYIEIDSLDDIPDDCELIEIINE